ncbi:MAG: hypothetical protein E7374_03375 [Clostridiales bacterium]|nr:hypothetical protein [Clostridiales bacterium]
MDLIEIWNLALQFQERIIMKDQARGDVLLNIELSVAETCDQIDLMTRSANLYKYRHELEILRDHVKFLRTKHFEGKPYLLTSGKSGILVDLWNVAEKFCVLMYSQDQAEKRSITKDIVLKDLNTLISSNLDKSEICNQLERIKKQIESYLQTGVLVKIQKPVSDAYSF